MALLPTIAAGQTDAIANLNQAYRKLNGFVDVKADFGATGDGVTDDTAALQAAITAAGSGAVYFPTGTYITSGTLTPVSNSSWRTGGGNIQYSDPTGGVILKYTGTGTAIESPTNLFGWYADPLKLWCTGTGAVGIHYTDPTNNCCLRGWTLTGPGTGTGILHTGQSSCTCHNVYDTVALQNWTTALHLSGFSNANSFRDCSIFTCTTGIDTTPTGTDTTGGSDNLFTRCEFDGGITSAFTLVNADRNCFVKCVMDGATSASVDSDCASTVFIACNFAGLTDDSTTTVYVGCTGAGTPAQGFQLADDTAIYRQGAGLWRIVNNIVVPGGGANQAANIGGYSGSLSSSTGMGVFGNSEFQNALAIGGALNHDGTQVGFYGTAPVSKPTVTGSRGGNAALASLLTQLASLGLITDSSSA